MSNDEITQERFMQIVSELDDFFDARTPDSAEGIALMLTILQFYVGDIITSCYDTKEDMHRALNYFVEKIRKDIEDHNPDNPSGVIH